MTGNSSKPADDTTWKPALASIRKKIQQIFQGDGCNAHDGWCILPLYWEWHISSEKTPTAHATVVGFDHKNRHMGPRNKQEKDGILSPHLHMARRGPLQVCIQWFFDPAEHQDPPLSVIMRDAEAVLFSDYRNISISISGNHGARHPMQNAFEPSAMAVRCGLVDGCCSTVCILFVVLVWRFGVITENGIEQREGRVDQKQQQKKSNEKKIPLCKPLGWPLPWAGYPME